MLFLFGLNGHFKRRDINFVYIQSLNGGGRNSGAQALTTFIGGNCVKQ